MKCPLTGKVCPNPQTFEINEFIDGKKQNFSLCQDCAAQYLTNPSICSEIKTSQEKREETVQELQGMITEMQDKTVPMTPALLLKNLVERLNGKKAKPEESAPPAPEPRCPGCQSSAKDIAKIKKLGCMKCFDFFGKSILIVLNKIHGHTSHVGKVPKRWALEQAKAMAKKEALAKKKIPVEQTIEELEELLREAVRDEDYDKAAQVRDRLKAIRPLQAERLQLNEELKKACAVEDLEQCDILKHKIIEVMKKINEHR